MLLHLPHTRKFIAEHVGENSIVHVGFLPRVPSATRRSASHKSLAFGIGLHPTD